MDHGYFQDRISAYLDQELTPYEYQVVGEHLKTCKECRELLHRLEKLDALVQQQAQLDGEDYWERSAQNIEQQLDLQEKAKQPATVSRWRGVGWKLVAAAASIAIITFIGLHKDDIKTTKPAPAIMEAPRITIPDTLQTKKPVTDSQTMMAETPTDESMEVMPPPTPMEKHDTGISRQQTTSDRKTTAHQKQVIQKKKKGIQPPSEAARKVEKDQLSLEKSSTPVQEKEQQAEYSQTLPTTEKLTGSDTGVQARTKGIVQSLSANKDSDHVETKANKHQAGKAVGDSVSAELAVWMNRRDSLKTLWNSLQKDEKHLTLPKTAPSKQLSSIDTVEWQLLESYYHIARLSHITNPEQEDQAKEFFREYLKRTDIRHREAARDYLHRLEVELKEDKTHQ